MLEKTVTVRITETASEHDRVRESVLERLRAFNRRRAEAPDFQPISLVVHDGDEFVGGLVGEIGWKWLFVELLWVSETHRGRGLGTELLQSAEREAARRGARHAYLDTFDFQARPFYERQGYTVFGCLDDYPPGHQRFFLRKDLASR